MSLKSKLLLIDIENSILFLKKYDLQLNDSLLFDQSQYLKCFCQKWKKMKISHHCYKMKNG
jgi:hypothetical protein